MFLAPLRAAPPPLLNEAVKNWMAGKDDLAFTVRTRATGDGGKLRDERVERYDPSQPDDRRWRLIEVNGRPPSEDERKRSEERKNRKARKRPMKPLGDLFDFDTAMQMEETRDEVRYAVAMRPEAVRQIDVEKLGVEVTVNKQKRMIERVTAELREPARVAFGLAKILDADLDVFFDPTPDEPATNPSEGEIEGTARVVVRKLGDYPTIYEWSEFERVARYRASR